MYIARDEDSFRGLSFSFAGFVAQSALADIPQTDFFLYGSFVRSAWTREVYGDINIAFRTHTAGTKLDAQMRERLRIVPAAHLYQRPEDLLNEADFSVCQAVYHDGNLHVSSVFFENVAQRLLVLNRIASASSAYSSLCRVLKYAQRGYVISSQDFARLVRESASAERTRVEDVYRRHSGGVLI